ncbi:MAG: hypothetical protein ACI4OV_03595 [Victivallaceae bacterium]
MATSHSSGSHHHHRRHRSRHNSQSSSTLWFGFKRKSVCLSILFFILFAALIIMAYLSE